MADVLFNIRTMFVKKVSSPVLDLLADHLLQRRVLNDAEVGEVKEEHRQKMDRARSLIDTVRRKGDEASNQLMRCLQEEDPALFKELGLTCPMDQR